jgi:hypothetical protein
VSMLLNRGGKSGHPCLLPLILGEIQSFAIKYEFSYSFFQTPLSNLGFSILCLGSWKFLSCMCLNFVKFSLGQLLKWLCFFFFCSLIWWIILLDF